MKILARTKLKDEPYVVIIGDTPEDNLRNDAKDSYKPPNILESIKFTNPQYALEDEEWFYIELVDTDKKEEMLGGYIEASRSMASINQIRGDCYSKVDCIFGVDGCDILFTKITPSFVIKNKFIIEIESIIEIGPIKKLDLKQAQIRSQAAGIEFNPSKIDAFYKGDENKLYFRSFRTVNSLFPGINEYYRDASEEEVRKFLELDIFEVDKSITPDKINSGIVKRIAAITDDPEIGLYDNSNNCKKKTIDVVNSIEKGALGVEVQNDKILLKRPADVRVVCDILLGNIYRSPITDDMRRTSGNIRIEGANN
jgi:hypothetical protein